MSESSRQMLIGNLTSGSQEFPALGYIVFWNVRNVSINLGEFTNCLVRSNINTKYAKEHNYRSAFIRALKTMNENRIIRLVNEHNSQMSYQFTAEERIEQGEDSHLTYSQETLITIDKSIYYRTQNIRAAITKGSPEIKEKIIEKFMFERNQFNSSDITAFFQKILKDGADIVSLREQGSVYFVPIGYQPLLNKLINFSSLVNGVSFVCVPLPDVESARSMINNAVKEETTDQYTTIFAEVEIALRSKQEISTIWAQTRLNRINELKERVDMYRDILVNSATDMDQKLEALANQLSAPRKLEI